MSSRSFKYWPEVIGVAAAILCLSLSSCAPEDNDSYYTYRLPRYSYCIDVEGKTYFVQDFSRRSIQFAGDSTLEFTDIDGVEYSFKNVSYCKRRIPVKPTKREDCGNALPVKEPAQYVTPTKCASCGNALPVKEPPQHVKPVKCDACGRDLTGKAPTYFVKLIKCEACGSDLTGKEPPQPVKPIKCEACGSDLTGKEHEHAR